jgi:NAD(P)-dependent dehydrogenase (short-subunit alcohol dehydrogenase family)
MGRVLECSVAGPHVAMLGDKLNGGWTMLDVSGQPGLSGERFRWIEADLLQAAVAHISQTASQLDAIICAAGVQHTAPPRALDHGFGRQMWQLHVDEPTRLVDALVPRLVDGGRVVVIGSRTSSGAAGRASTPPPRPPWLA